MSVNRAINDLIPPEWYYVLKKNRVLTHFIKYMYEYCVPQCWRNKFMFKRSIERIKFRINLGFIFCFDPHNTSEGYDFWKKIDLEITNYIEQCR